MFRTHFFIERFGKVSPSHEKFRFILSEEIQAVISVPLEPLGLAPLPGFPLLLLFMTAPITHSDVRAVMTTYSLPDPGLTPSDMLDAVYHFGVTITQSMCPVCGLIICNVFL